MHDRIKAMRRRQTLNNLVGQKNGFIIAIINAKFRPDLFSTVAGLAIGEFSGCLHAYPTVWATVQRSFEGALAAISLCALECRAIFMLAECLDEPHLSSPKL